MTHPLIEEAGKKASIGWFSVDGGPAHALWCMPLDGRIFLVTGAGEQKLPGIGEESVVTVTLRGDHGGNVVSYPATVTQIRPEMDVWETVAPQLAGKRLNSSGPAEQVVERWSRECAIWALAPAGDPLPRSTASGAAEPRPTIASNAGWKPFKLHRVRRRR
ncbi:hypothetical protein [Allorhizocola rhizosphaerae]|uniref:hypothetical protein n=1 Tax=Allorhizocola rhizosphaerae TaxID=1872709 RepID=UPI000E3CE843|nr:hypothetical protein [Allorhizocola rhizosphaerae]